MGRLRSKKFRAHAPAAQSTAAKGKKPSKPVSASAASAAVAAEAAVKAAFASEDANDELMAVGDNDASGDENEGGDDELSGLSRGQRKRMKRRGAFMRKMGMVQRVVQEKEKAQKKQELGVFAEIKELQDSLFLSDKELAAIAASKISQSTNVTSKTTTTSATAAAAKPKKLSGKQRQKLAVRELGQLKAVHTHPQFQNDPFAAIQMHLQNTVVQANQPTLDKQKKASAAASSKTKSKNDMDIE